MIITYFLVVPLRGEDAAGGAEGDHLAAVPWYSIQLIYPYYLYTECSKIYRKLVLHLLKYTPNINLSRCSTFWR